MLFEVLEMVTIVSSLRGVLDVDGSNSGIRISSAK